MAVLKVRIMTPQKMLYDGPAFAVSSKNSSGPFDILAGHANFITIIKSQPITVTKQDNSKVIFNFSQAIIYNASNVISVYAEPTT